MTRTDIQVTRDADGNVVAISYTEDGDRYTDVVDADGTIHHYGPATNNARSNA